ncbi:MAG: hypothetical protein AABZ64_06015, partial [Nitrospinota bacterium]
LPESRPQASPAPAPEPARAPRERASAVASPDWDPAGVRRAWAEAVGSLRATRQALFEGTQLEFGEPGQLRLRVPPANGHAQTLDLIRDTLPAIESHFAQHAPWAVRIALETPAPAAAPEAAPGEDDARRKEEQSVIQEVVDLFNGQIVDIRPVRGRRAGGPRAAEGPSDTQGED